MCATKRYGAEYEVAETAPTLGREDAKHNAIPMVLTFVVAYTVHGEHSTAMTGGGSAKVAFPARAARSLDTTGGYATNQGGTVVASILSAGESPVRTGPSPGNAPASRAPGPACSSTGATGSQQTSLFGPDGSCSKTSLGFSPLPTDETLPSFSARWPTSGTASPGGYWTLDTSEFPSDAVECSLSDILEESPDRRFTLSPRAARGILRRASVRGRPLPPELEAALRAVAE